MLSIMITKREKKFSRRKNFKSIKKKKDQFVFMYKHTK